MKNKRREISIYLAAGDYTAKFLATFEEFPPRKKAGSFTIGDAKNMIYNAMGSK